MIDNLCERFKANRNSYETKIHRVIPHHYFVPQEDTDEYDRFNHRLNHDTRKKTIFEELCINKHKTIVIAINEDLEQLYCLPQTYDCYTSRHGAIY